MSNVTKTTKPIPLQPTYAALTPDLYAQVIDLMIEERLPLLAAANTLAIPLSPEEATNHLRRKPFKDLFAAKQRAYYEAQAGPAALSKASAVGRMLENARQLEVAGRPKDAADILAAACKIMGWAGAETSINIFSDLSGTERSELRERLAKRMQQEPPVV